MISGIHINPTVSSILVISLIVVDYVRKHNTDAFQRRIFLVVLSTAFLAVAMDFANGVLGGRPGEDIRIIMYAVLTVFLNSQNIAYYIILAFIDYFVYSNTARTRKIIAIAAVFLSLYFISTLLNLHWKFFFYISEDNYYSKGPLYPLRLVISYLPILIITVYVIAAIRSFKRSQVYLLILFALLSGFGATLDIVLKTGSLVWICFTAALLYIYFFIIQSDAKIDSLTGIGNRTSFNEFINRLARQNTRHPEGGRPWAIAMIDLDHFKKINDTLGHLEGDNALRDMASIIKSSIRHCDFAARYGGDEFIVGVRAGSAEQAGSVKPAESAESSKAGLEKVLARIKEAMEVQNEKNLRPYKIRMSYGYDIFNTNDGVSVRDFLAHIDGLMYKNKAEHRRASDHILFPAGMPERKS
ncbi:MAG: diguanylate cyclase [Treponema sp.]|jgi:diguanylate cyclase (GGDEF)-like protein|nr:diguanylate cyclase [Treponema sp.]